MFSTKGQYMEESNILAGNVTIKQLQRVVLLDTKGQYMKELNTLAGYATIKQRQRVILMNTKRQFMKEQIPLIAMQLSSKFKGKS